MSAQRTASTIASQLPKTSPLVSELKFQLRVLELPAPKEEVRVVPHRRFVWDLAWSDRMLAVECQGSIYSQGHHTRGRGYTDDCIKMAEGLLAGWRILWITSDMVKSGQAVDYIVRALELKEMTP